MSYPIKPEDWFFKYRHISIKLNGDFDKRDPFKSVKDIEPCARSVEIRIMSSFDDFGKAKAAKYLRQVIQCIDTNIEWLAIKMNGELATDYLDECADILKNISGLYIRLFEVDRSLKMYRLDAKCLQLKTLSLHNCSQFITNIGNWPKLENLSIYEESNLELEKGIANFIQQNKQLKCFNIDSDVLRLDRIDVAFDDGLHHLKELSVHNASLSFFFDRFCRNLRKLQNISRLEFYNVKFSGSEWKNETVNGNEILDDFDKSLYLFKTLKHLTVKFKGWNPLGFDLISFMNCNNLESLAISAYQLNEDNILRLVRNSNSLITLHMHAYNGKLSNTLIKKIAKERADWKLKDRKLNLFVGGKHGDFTKIAKEESVKQFINVFMCTNCELGTPKIDSDDLEDAEMELDITESESDSEFESE